MYIPPSFSERDESVLLELAASHPLAQIVTSHQGQVLVNFAPAVLVRTKAGIAARFHLAQRNPQAGHLREHGRCTLSFLGPNCYVSPSWYTEHPSVPTWNYLAVQLTGPAAPLCETELESLLRHLTASNEAEVGGSWRYEDMPDAFRRQLLAEITGFEVAVERIEAKSKLSQNRSAVDRARVCAQLSASESHDARMVAAWMRRRMPSLG
jgi:transcriptional regulator